MSPKLQIVEWTSCYYSPSKSPAQGNDREILGKSRQRNRVHRQIDIESQRCTASLRDGAAIAQSRRYEITVAVFDIEVDAQTFRESAVEADGSRNLAQDRLCVRPAFQHRPARSTRRH